MSDRPFGPKLLHHFKKSINGPNLVEDHKDKEVHHEENVPEEPAVAAETQAKDDIKPTTNGGEDITNDAPTNGVEQDNADDYKVSSNGGDSNHSPSASSDDAADEDNDPTALADRIRSLVQSLPQPTVPVPVPSKPKLPQLDTNGRPVLPEDAVRVHDSKLIAILRNPVVMNGRAAHASGDKGQGNPTVWMILDSFQAPAAHVAGQGKGGSTGPLDDDGADDDEDIGKSDIESDNGSEIGEHSHVILDDSSVMFYTPLIPIKDSKVEMADFQIVPITSSTNGAKLAASVKEHLGDAESKIMEMLSPGQYRMYGTYGRRTAPPGVNIDGEPAEETQVVRAKFSWKFWPWKKKTPAPAPKPPDTATPAPGDDKDKMPDTVPANGDQKKPRPRKLRKPKPILNHRVWVPSRTGLSIQVLWWGYRVFLPPPVLNILSDKTIEATKRAAMITTALTWLFSKLPISIFPPPMQPALRMLQQLVPYLGYIGTFITWSWSTIKSYDVGYGVILSATWILPVALVPGTWQVYDFPADGGNNGGSTSPAPDQPSKPSTGAPTTPAPGRPSTGTPTPSQPSTTVPTQPSTGAPTQPSTGTPTTSAPAQPSTGAPDSVNAPIGTEPPAQSPTNDTTLPPTEAPVSINPAVSTRLRMVKGIDEPADRLAKIKGDGSVPAVDEDSKAVEKSNGYGFWKYITG
ncbi:hypothetical protein Moror_11850 [Moniliophthora roreri MCA 2997]|uniref:Uncharacterized protein n=2 Tax=Moniliophthora roreri TaxID=221103 RepID=V2X025_MONRO|nr:hypothetical protein Moror_11850 [Moniliophthora roreri MCA 2997]KAI3607638.1 hypothetical protein WG66_004519 [Moniliophthora roreri]